MKSLFFLLFFPFLLFSEINIVFVHIGKNVPKYVFDALKQAKLFNKTAPIYLLANRDAIGSLENLPEGVNIIDLESLEPSAPHRYFSIYSMHSRTSMEGFWHHTIERFFYLEEFAKKYSLVNIFHLENDVMLYRDLEEILPVFLEYYPAIGATFDTDTRVIPGFIFFRNAKTLFDLSRYLCKVALKNLDMMSIASYRNQTRKENIDFLPIIFPQYTEIQPLINSLGKEPSNPNNYSKHFDKFDSIFDAAALGQYLGGISPRNTNNIVPGFINETCIFNPSKLQYVWLQDDEERKVPYIKYRDSFIRINNLHIHSKQLEKFAS